MTEGAARKATLGAIFLTIFLDLVGFGMILPLLPLYAKRFGAGGLEVGLLAATYSAGQLLFAPFWGRLSDRTGRRPVLLISIALGALAMLAFGLAQSLPVLFAARALAGFGGANLSTARAYIADVTLEGDRAKGMGLVGAAFGLGFILGPAIGGVLAHYGGTAAPGLFAAGLGAINWVLALVRLPESRRPRPTTTRRGWLDWRGMRAALAKRDIQLLIGLFLLLNLGFTGLEQAFVLYTSERFSFTARDVGYVFVFIGAVSAIVQGLFIGRLTHAFGELTLLRVGIPCLATGMALIPFAPGLPLLLGSLAFVAVGNAFCHPSIASLLSRRSAEDVQGGTLGVQDSAGGLARIVGPTAAGLAYDHLAHAAPFWLGAVVVASAIPFALRIGARARRE